MRVVILNKHGWVAVAFGKSRVFIVHDGRQIILEAKDISLVPCVFIESILETYRTGKASFFLK